MITDDREHVRVLGLRRILKARHTYFTTRSARQFRPEMETGRVDRHRSGYPSGRDSSTGRSSRLKHRSNIPFLQLKGI